VGRLLGLELTVIRSRTIRSTARSPPAVGRKGRRRLGRADFRRRSSPAARWRVRGMPGAWADASDGKRAGLRADAREHRRRAGPGARGLVRGGGAGPHADRRRRGMLYVPFLNYAQGSLDPARAMLVHADTVPASPTAAPMWAMICDGSFPTTMITHWTARPHAGREDPPQGRGADADAGYRPRGGALRPGPRRARLSRRSERHRLRRARPACATGRLRPAAGGGGDPAGQRLCGHLVAGQITYRDGEPTGVLPGRLLRGAQRAPSCSPRNRKDRS